MRSAKLISSRFPLSIAGTLSAKISQVSANRSQQILPLNFQLNSQVQNSGKNSTSVNPDLFSQKSYLRTSAVSRDEKTQNTQNNFTSQLNEVVREGDAKKLIEFLGGVTYGGGATAIHKMVFVRNNEALKLLLSDQEVRQYIDEEVVDMGAPLHCAIKLQDDQIVKTLLEAGANPNKAKRYDGNTPMHLATENKASRIIALLFKYEAKINVVNKNGETPYLNSHHLDLSASNDELMRDSTGVEKGGQELLERYVPTSEHDPDEKIMAKFSKLLKSAELSAQEITKKGTEIAKNFAENTINSAVNGLESRSNRNPLKNRSDNRPSNNPNNIPKSSNDKGQGEGR